MNIWKPIPDFENYYASITGEILSLVKEKPLVLSQALDSKGYLVVNIESKVRRVHRLVASAFLGLDYGDTKKCVLHKDDNPENNNITNLSLGSQADNLADMRSKGRHSFGNRHAKKLSRQKVNLIRERLFNGEAGIKLAAEYGVSVSMISAIRNNHRWHNG